MKGDKALTKKITLCYLPVIASGGTRAYWAIISLMAVISDLQPSTSNPSQYSGLLYFLREFEHTRFFLIKEGNQVAYS